MIPNKSSFKFQELTPITGVKPYVIRYWETEFPEISPITSDSGQKIYARKDVEAILKIKKLLFDEKMTIPEAKESISSFAALDGSSNALVDERREDLKPLIFRALDFIREIKSRRNW